MKRFLTLSVLSIFLYSGLNNASVAGSGVECTSACTDDCPVIKGVAQKCVRNKKTNKCSCQNPTTMPVDDESYGTDEGLHINPSRTP